MLKRGNAVKAVLGISSQPSAKVHSQLYIQPVSNIAMIVYRLYLRLDVEHQHALQFVRLIGPVTVNVFCTGDIPQQLDGLFPITVSKGQNRFTWTWYRANPGPLCWSGILRAWPSKSAK
jgi:hypothetical protein